MIAASFSWGLLTTNHIKTVECMRGMFNAGKNRVCIENYAVSVCVE